MPDALDASATSVASMDEVLLQCTEVFWPCSLSCPQVLSLSGLDHACPQKLLHCCNLDMPSEQTHLLI